MAEVAGLLYNASGDVPCYNVTSLVGPAGPGRHVAVPVVRPAGSPGAALLPGHRQN